MERVTLPMGYFQEYDNDNGMIIRQPLVTDYGDYLATQITVYSASWFARPTCTLAGPLLFSVKHALHETEQMVLGD